MTTLRAADSTIKIAPSILAADFARLGEEVRDCEAAGADYIHIDIMDGHFVPNLTMGPMVVECIRPHTHLPLDVHLMIDSPERFVSQFAQAGAQIITFHQEACLHSMRLIEQIKGLNVRVGVALNPGTPAVMIEELLPFVDVLNIMTVNPGFGGQEFIHTMEQKIAKLRGMIEKGNFKIEVEVDGGIDPHTAPRVVRAGATVLIAGSFIFKEGQSIAHTIRSLRESVEEMN